jgi:1-deoxy-D-xylulose-5-phosphate reductoisomerase
VKPLRKIVILGSTGSIGQSTLRVCAALPEHFEVIGLAAASRIEPLIDQARAHGVKTIAVADVLAARQAAEKAPDLTVWSGPEGIERMAAGEGIDTVVCALVGMAGLRPVLAALERGTDVALATKEVLVAAGGRVTGLARRTGAHLLPVDSEHSAIFQCLQGQPMERVRRLVLTASGGPFAARADIDFEKVTVAEALNHPRWNMGKKVTVDSATLMNKGLEIMEAHWLFDIPLDRIEVLIHPESIVHSLVEFIDGSMLAQMSPPDMRYAIQYALTWPDRFDGGLPTLDLAKVGPLHFSAPDPARFPGLILARSAAATGGTLPAVLNAANEEAVALFLAGRIPFAGIWRTVATVMDRHHSLPDPELDAILEADRWARSAVRETVNAR